MPQLTSAPSLLPLYAKAAVTTPLHRFSGGGDSLPDSSYTLDDQSIDRAHLSAYQRVCGFATSDELPPTYLHILAFPLSVALMTENGFPFPLVGLVHVANAITVHRTVRADEVVSLRVHAEDLRDHPAGRQFDLVAEARVGDELVWNGRSTYLRRGKPSGDPAKKSERPELAPLQGAVATLRVPGDIGRRYGAISGDRNPIHLHPLSARLFGFPSAIGHGMWLAARTLASLEGRLPDAFDFDVAFKLPVLLPATVSVATSPDGAGWQLDVRDRRSGKPHLTGSITPR